MSVATAPSTAPSAVRAARASRYVSSLSARALARAPDPGAEDQDDEDDGGLWTRSCRSPPVTYSDMLERATGIEPA